MLELGPDSAAMHQTMAQHLTPDAIEEVFLYGSEMSYLADKLRKPMHQLTFILLKRRKK